MSGLCDANAQHWTRKAAAPGASIVKSKYPQIARSILARALPTNRPSARTASASTLIAARMLSWISSSFPP